MSTFYNYNDIYDKIQTRKYIFISGTLIILNFILCKNDYL